jgi:cytochrome c6
MARAGRTDDSSLPTTSSHSPAAAFNQRPPSFWLAAAAAAAASAAAVLVVVALAPPPALAADGASAATPAASAFALKCAGCHAGGGNLLQAGATLATADLQRNGYGDADSLYALIYGGKGRMPGFGADCAPKGQCTFGARLSDGEVRDLADYVLRRAGEGWAAEG